MARMGRFTLGRGGGGCGEVGMVAVGRWLWGGGERFGGWCTGGGGRGEGRGIRGLAVENKSGIYQKQPLRLHELQHLK